LALVTINYLSPLITSQHLSKQLLLNNNNSTHISTALCTELATLDLLKSQHAQAEETLAAEELEAAKIRKELLTAVQSRHSVELQVLQIKHDSQEIDKSITQLQASTNDIRAKTKELECQFDKEHAPIYAKHDVSTKLYSMKSETTLVAAQCKKQRREIKLSSLKEQTHRQTKEAEDMRTETERIRDECLELDHREEEDDEETVALSMKIKTLLSKKASLRAAAAEAREMQQTAKSNCEMWERKCVEGN